MSDHDDEAARQEAISYLQTLIEAQQASREEPQIMGGPYQLSARQLLREVQEGSVVGREFVDAFAKVRREFP